MNELVSLILGSDDLKTEEHERMEQFYILHTKNESCWPSFNFQINRDGVYISEFARLLWAGWQAAQHGASA